MHPAARKVLSGMLLVGWIFLCGELAVRAISAVADIYTIEMLEYAKSLKRQSPIPTLSHEHVPNAAATLMGVEIRLNSLGHRSAELNRPKGPRERRIHVIGSSIALGWGVAQGQDFVSLLERQLNEELGAKNGRRYVGINAGVGNYNTYYQVELFKRQVDVTLPDVVVLQYYINDAEPNPRGEASLLLKHSAFIAIAYQHFKTIKALAAKPLSEYYANLYTDEQESWRNARTAMRELQRICQDRGIPLVAVLVPELHDLSEGGPYPPIYAKIARAFADLGIPMIDGFLPFREAFADDVTRAWVAADDPHPNAAAHRIIADAIFRYLAEREI